MTSHPPEITGVDGAFSKAHTGNMSRQMILTSDIPDVDGTISKAPSDAEAIRAVPTGCHAHPSWLAECGLDDSRLSQLLCIPDPHRPILA